MGRVDLVVQVDRELDPEGPAAGRVDLVVQVVPVDRELDPVALAAGQVDPVVEEEAPVVPEDRQDR